MYVCVKKSMPFESLGAGLPARFHQFFHLLRASYLRAACGVPPNPLVANLADKELGPHDIPVISCPLRVSLAADAFAVKKLREYRSGAIIQWAWCSTGHVKEQELADWCYNGKKEDLDKSMELCRGGFRDMLFMSQVPEVDHSVW